MINYKELRIGNYFFADGLVQSVSAISSKPDDDGEEALISYYKDEQLVSLPAHAEQITPITINDEVLERCGFKFDSYFKLWQKMKKVLGTGVDMELSRDYAALDFSHRPILKEIEHLHHLQNLYYALKRKELIVDLTLNQKLETYATVI